MTCTILSECSNRSQQNNAQTAPRVTNLNS
uniref:Uncharacterized protein n=1 Tax=Arundo donax TaxID=35708 RepID=A0A0A8Y6T0_ARUDO